MVARGLETGKGKGKAPLPPPQSAKEVAKMRRVKAEKDRLQRAEDKRSALARIEEARQKESRERAFVARLSTLTSCELEDVPWDTASMHVRVKGGREQGESGVHIVEFGNGSAICLRNVWVTEIVAEKTAAAMNVKIANMRIVKPSDFEYASISAMRGRLCGASFGHFHSRGPIMVLQFVPGCDLSCVQSELSHAFFHGLGRICALDVLLNNMDRVPLPVWDNLGNLTNVMIDTEGCPVGIDQQVNLISDSRGMESYIARVRNLVQLVVTSSAVDDFDAARLAVQHLTTPLRRALCGFEVSETMAKVFVQGLGEGLEDAAKSWATGFLERSLTDAEHVAENVSTQDAAASEPRAYADFVRRVVGEIVSVLHIS